MKSSLFFQATPRAALIALNAVPGLAPRTAFKLSQRKDWVDLLSGLSVSEASLALGVSDKAVINLLSFPAVDFARSEEGKANISGVRIVTILDDEYPLRLKEIADPPIVLYINGFLPASDEAVIAIVGARQATAYGLGIAEKFSMRLAESGVVVISGMARGIDAAAHRGALKGGGRTIGVLGCGLDIVYPAQNKELFAKVIHAGALISEFPFGTEPYPYHFPRRNRVVSALSHGVVVVEANIRSGALITAEFAMEQGREVYAVPGRVDSPQSGGPHKLICQGAKLTVAIEDVIEDLPVLREQPELFDMNHDNKKADLTSDEAKLVHIIAEGRISFDMLTVRSALPLSVLAGVCLSLQLRGLIKEYPGKIYELVS